MDEVIKKGLLSSYRAWVSLPPPLQNALSMLAKFEEAEMQERLQKELRLFDDKRLREDTRLREDPRLRDFERLCEEDLLIKTDGF